MSSGELASERYIPLIYKKYLDFCKRKEKRQRELRSMEE